MNKNKLNLHKLHFNDIDDMEDFEDEKDIEDLEDFEDEEDIEDLEDLEDEEDVEKSNEVIRNQKQVDNNSTPSFVSYNVKIIPRILKIFSIPEINENYIRGFIKKDQVVTIFEESLENSLPKWGRIKSDESVWILLEYCEKI